MSANLTFKSQKKKTSMQLHSYSSIHLFINYSKCHYWWHLQVAYSWQFDIRCQTTQTWAVVGPKSRAQLCFSMIKKNLFSSSPFFYMCHYQLILIVQKWHRSRELWEKIALVAFLQILNNPQQTIILQIYVSVCVCVQLMPYSGDSVVVYTAKIHNHHVFWLMIPVLVYFYCSAVTNFGHNRQSGKTVMKSMKMNKVGNKQKRLPFP